MEDVGATTTSPTIAAPNTSASSASSRATSRAARHDRLRGVEIERRRPSVRRLESNPATPGNALVLSIDIRLQALVEQLFGDRRGALVAIDPRERRVPGLCQQAELRPQPVRRRDRRRELARPQRVARQAAAEPGAARHLPAGSTFKPFMALAALTLGKRTPQQTVLIRAFSIRRPPLPRRQGGRPRHRRHVQFDRSSHATPTTTCSPTTSGRPDARLHGAAGFGRLTGIDLQGELKGALPSTRVEAHRATRRGSAEVVRRRDDLPRHRPGLQQLHPCCSWRRPKPPSRPAAALHAASGARGRELRDARRARATVPAARADGLETRASPSSRTRSTA